MDIPDVEVERQIGEYNEPGPPEKLIIGSNLPDRNMRANQPENWTEYEFSFVCIQIDTELFPSATWRECSRLALGRSALPIWTSEAVDIDCPDLIFQLRQRLLHYRFDGRIDCECS